MNITITGNLGAGKSSVCACLKQQGYEIISTGSIFREVAAEKGLSVLEMNELAKTDPSIDALIDNRSIRLGKEKDNAIFDSRMAWNFIPDSFKIFLLVDIGEAAKRVFADHTRDTEKYASEEEAEKHLFERAMLEQARFKELYGVDYFSIKNYNLIIDSTGATPEQITEEILRNFDLYKEKPFSGKVELCTSNLYPSKPFQELSADKLQDCLLMEGQKNSLCASGTIPAAQKNGYVYILEGHHSAFAALSAGKPFAEVALSADCGETIAPMSTEQLHTFESFGKFQYKYYPETVAERKGYLFEFF